MFKLESNFKPAGDQSGAIEKLVSGLESGSKFQTLLGVTGSGKTYTIANVIEKVQNLLLFWRIIRLLQVSCIQSFVSFFLLMQLSIL